MARFLKVADLAERKKALVAESEAYRQVLHLEIQNLRGSGSRWRRTFSALSLSNPLILAALPLLTSLIRRRRAASTPKLRLVTAAFFGWRILRNTWGLLSRMFLRKSRPGNHSEAEEQSAAI
jgi:hypothetical protein